MTRLYMKKLKLVVGDLVPFSISLLDDINYLTI